MLKLLATIVETISTLIQFLINTITSLITIIANIPTFVDYLVSSFAFLPDMVLPFCVASLSLLVVLFMIGRN